MKTLSFFSELANGLSSLFEGKPKTNITIVTVIKEKSISQIHRKNLYEEVFVLIQKKQKGDELIFEACIIKPILSSILGGKLLLLSNQEKAIIQLHELDRSVETQYFQII